MQTSPRGRRPSISKPIAWLARASHTQQQHPAPAPIHQISEPQLVNEVCAGTPNMHPRYGILGTGATVVRTPKDALARAAAAPTPPVDPPGVVDDDNTSNEEDTEPPSPTSPALHVLPLTSKSSPNLLSLDEPLPPIPFHIQPTPPQPPFSPVLLAPVPSAHLNPLSTIVTLETSTAALRTTYATLTSRPSHLADYLLSLARKPNFRDTLVEEDECAEEYEDDEDDGHRLSPPDTPFTSLFNAHLTSSGLLPQPPGVIHLFLDRPSAPYTHILAYLRTPPEHPALPRPVTLHDRLEDLLELRDEARFLGLDELHRLCSDTLRRRQGHVRGASSGGASAPSPSLRLRTVAKHRVSPVHDPHTDSDSPPSPSPRPRAKSPAGARSRSRGSPLSASDWI